MIHPGGAAVIVGVSILPTFFIRVLSRREQDERRQYMKEMGRVNQSASEGLYSMESVKANAMEDEFCAAYGASLEELYQKKKKLTKTTTLLTLPSVLCAFGMQVTILIVGGFLTATGAHHRRRAGDDDLADVLYRRSRDVSGKHGGCAPCLSGVTRRAGKLSG